MSSEKRIKSALISVFHKQGLDEVAEQLKAQGVEVYSTGGTADYLEDKGLKVNQVEDLTGYPSILGGRVKTLHPKVFGGILARRENQSDQQELGEHTIPELDLVVVDLYPFQDTVSSGASDQEIIEKIDIGGISLIRAAAKNFKDVLIISDQSQYDRLADILKTSTTEMATRKQFANEAFQQSASYDAAIQSWMGEEETVLRYGENPHQEGRFVGPLSEMLQQLNGKALSYNNILDIDAAVNLIADYTEKPTMAVLKHNNACGLAERDTVGEAWTDALAGDPVSAFGGIIISNTTIDLETAEGIDKIFYEVVIAPDYTEDALALLSKKEKRTVLKQLHSEMPDEIVRSALNGHLVQDRDISTQSASELTTVTTKQPTDAEIQDLVFANKLVKHTKSNAIILVKNGQLLASGTGQTSRVDALQQAIAKAEHFKFDLDGAVMASDAFFPFSDCVEIANKAGITAVIQPGGSIRDKDSIEYCDANNMAMVTTGVRHFKH